MVRLARHSRPFFNSSEYAVTRLKNIYYSIRTNNLTEILRFHETSVLLPPCYFAVEKPDVPVMCRRTFLVQSVARRRLVTLSVARRSTVMSQSSRL